MKNVNFVHKCFMTISSCLLCLEKYTIFIPSVSYFCEQIFSSFCEFMASLHVCFCSVRVFTVTFSVYTLPLCSPSSLASNLLVQHNALWDPSA